MSYNKHQQRVDRASHRKQLARQGFVQQQISAKLTPLDMSYKKFELRRKDVPVFKAAAQVFDHIILLRGTNPQSLQYIGNKNIYPKPIDCKPKTADFDASISFGSRRIFSKTAGLVVDPTIVGAQAFKDGKYNDALKEWENFLKDKTTDEKKAKVFRRRGGASGCYAVDLNTKSDYYGCLMISRSGDVKRHTFEGQTIARNEGSQAFDDTAVQANSAWRGASVWNNDAGDYQTRMQYMHGDYDLYALLNVDDINESTIIEIANGAKNYCSKQLPVIQDFLNRGIGSPMIQHGDQFRFKHKGGDTIYAFYPTGSAYVFKETAGSIKEIFELLYGVN